MNEDKKFLIPEVEIVILVTDDIITYSKGSTYPDEWIGEDWGENN